MKGRGLIFCTKVNIDPYYLHGKISSLQLRWQQKQLKKDSVKLKLLRALLWVIFSQDDVFVSYSADAAEHELAGFKSCEECPHERCAMDTSLFVAKLGSI